VRRPFDPDHPARYAALTGCDEVGRGPLAGPVVAAAVWFDPARLPRELLAGLDDSKELGLRDRTTLAHLLQRHARIAVAAVSAHGIDQLDIRQATLTAMHRALHRLAIDGPALIDGRDVPPGLPQASARIRGDAEIPQIAAASIVAKVLRDRLMARLATRHPGYGWERNAGYGTAEHLAALTRLGPTRHHRMSFAPVAACACQMKESLRREGA
jgi:ribonuclease HII